MVIAFFFCLCKRTYLNVRVNSRKQIYFGKGETETEQELEGEIKRKKGGHYEELEG